MVARYVCAPFLRDLNLAFGVYTTFGEIQPMFP
jgi:hypothetical protein